MFLVGFIIALRDLFSKEKILVIYKKGFFVIEFLFFKTANNIKEIYYKDLEKIIVLKKKDHYKYSFIKDDNEIFCIRKDTNENVNYHKDIEILLSTYENSKN